MSFFQSVGFHLARALVEVGVWIAAVVIVLLVVWAVTRDPAKAAVRKREKERRQFAQNRLEDEILPQPDRCGFDKAGRVIPGYAGCTREVGHEGPCAHPLAPGNEGRVLGSVKLYPALRDTTLAELSALVASQILNDRGFRSALAMKLGPLLDPPPVDVQALAVEVAQLLTPSKD